MKRVPRRICLAVLAMAASCSDQPRDGYTWYKAVPALSKYEWHLMGRDALQAKCHFLKEGGEGHACVERHWGTDTCHVFSRMTETEARKFKPAGTFGGTTLFEHEVWDEAKTRGHCAGFDHIESYLGQPIRSR